MEPARHDAFRMDLPFTSLPNVIASTHNSGPVPEALPGALRNAIANCRRALAGEVPLHVVDRNA